jgi:hypothetical protein
MITRETDALNLLPAGRDAKLPSPWCARVDGESCARSASALPIVLVLALPADSMANAR